MGLVDCPLAIMDEPGTYAANAGELMWTRDFALHKANRSRRYVPSLIGTHRTGYVRLVA